MDWTADQKSRFTEMWLAGVSTVEIGREFGVSKGSVVGTARRLELPPHAGFNGGGRTKGALYPRHGGLDQVPE